MAAVEAQIIKSIWGSSKKGPLSINAILNLYFCQKSDGITDFSPRMSKD
jgi:hypothetical protein